MVFLSLLLVGISIGGYFIWLENSYQTEEAEQMMAQALEHLDSAHREADDVIDCLKKIDRLMDAKSESDRQITRESVAKIQAEISTAKTASAAINAELVAFESNLDTAQVFKLKDDYSSYISMRRESSVKMHEFIDSTDKSIAVLEQLTGYFNTGLDIFSRYEAFEFSMDPQTFHDQSVQYKADLQTFSDVEKGLITTGVLPEVLTEMDQFHINCEEKIITLSNTVLADDFPAYESSVADLESSCSDAKIDESIDKMNVIWDQAWFDFFDGAIDEAREKNGEAERSRRDADDFSGYAV